MELFAVQAKLRPEVSEVAVNEVVVEDVVAGGDGRVRGEDGVGGGNLARHSERHAQPVDQLAAAFQIQEGGVALIHVPDERVNSQGAQRPHAADPQYNLLRDSHLVIATVEPRGERAVGETVRLDIRIHEVERDASHLDAPHFGLYLASYHIHRDDDFVAVVVRRGSRGDL